MGEGVLGVEGEELAVVVLVVDIGWRKLRDNMDNCCGVIVDVLFFVFYFFCFVVSSKSRKFVGLLCFRRNYDIKLGVFSLDAPMSVECTSVVPR